MVKCPRCGNENPDTNMFCEYCGSTFKISDINQKSSTENNNRHTSPQPNTKDYVSTHSDFNQQGFNNNQNQYNTRQNSNQYGYNPQQNNNQNYHNQQKNKHSFTDKISNISKQSKIIISVVVLCCIGIILIAFIASQVSDQGTLSIDDSNNISSNDITNQDFKKSEGTYSVGEDLPAGEYLFTQTSSVGGYVCRSSDSSGDSDSILGNGLTTTKGETLYVTVHDGEYLEFTGGEIIPVNQSETSTTLNNDEYKDGMYKVGVDIEPGEYKFTQTDSIGGYVELCSDSSLSFDSLVKNKATETIGETYYITIDNGQYVIIQGGTLVKV